MSSPGQPALSVHFVLGDKVDFSLLVDFKVYGLMGVSTVCVFVSLISSVWRMGVQKVAH